MTFRYLRCKGGVQCHTTTSTDDDVVQNNGVSRTKTFCELGVLLVKMNLTRERQTKNNRLHDDVSYPTLQSKWTFCRTYRDRKPPAKLVVRESIYHSGK